MFLVLAHPGLYTGSKTVRIVMIVGVNVPDGFWCWLTRVILAVNQ